MKTDCGKHEVKFLEKDQYSMSIKLGELITCNCLPEGNLYKDDIDVDGRCC